MGKTNLRNRDLQLRELRRSLAARRTGRAPCERRCSRDTSSGGAGRSRDRRHCARCKAPEQQVCRVVARRAEGALAGWCRGAAPNGRHERRAAIVGDRSATPHGSLERRAGASPRLPLRRRRAGLRAGHGRGDRRCRSLPEIVERLGLHSRLSLRSRARSSGVCSRTMVRAVWRGIRPGVARDTTTAVAKAIGIVHAAGCPSRAPGPARDRPGEDRDRHRGRRQAPPTTSPAAAPDGAESAPPGAQHQQRAERRRGDGERQAHHRREARPARSVSTRHTGRSRTAPSRAGTPARR